MIPPPCLARRKQRKPEPWSIIYLRLECQVLKTFVLFLTTSNTQRLTKSHIVPTNMFAFLPPHEKHVWKPTLKVPRGFSSLLMWENQLQPLTVFSLRHVIWQGYPRILRTYVSIINRSHARNIYLHVVDYNSKCR